MGVVEGVVAVVGGVAGSSVTGSGVVAFLPEENKNKL